MGRVGAPWALDLGVSTIAFRISVRFHGWPCRNPCGDFWQDNSRVFAHCVPLSPPDLLGVLGPSDLTSLRSSVQSALKHTVAWMTRARLPSVLPKGAPLTHSYTHPPAHTPVHSTRPPHPIKKTDLVLARSGASLPTCSVILANSPDHVDI